MTISIISLLASIVFAVIQYSRVRAVDAAQQQTVHQINAALEMRLSEKGEAPVNPLGNYEETSNQAFVAYNNDEISRNCPPIVGQPGTGCEPGMNAFETVMYQLVEEGYLASMPKIPNNTSAIGYYNFGSGSPQGAVVFGALSLIEPTTEGQEGTCRFDSGSGTANNQQQNPQNPNQQSPGQQQQPDFGDQTLDSVRSQLTAQGFGGFDFGDWDPGESGGSITDPQVKVTDPQIYQRVNIFQPRNDGAYRIYNRDDGDGGNGGGEDMEVVYPTCDSVVPNTSYCLCSTF